MFIWPISVYYEDTDAGGVVYHANYLKFFERARSEWLTCVGISQTQLLKDDLAFVVKRASLDFICPARFEQKLAVHSQITEMTRTSIKFTQRLLDDNSVCYCEAEVLVVCVQLSKMRPKGIPSFIKQELLSAR
ncbi:tol-pal system-associated acyl-CoA thioesterase [Shewanella sp. NIFS-20-20]|uniref:tol-pal system-associated acyl-CoA thioesterase n=1 Tax=Shewanella sp. NIFS-20-20 TaxID=2853806 RepID=UPI001C43DE15|nr:tol-pal system-associated acyl-CoA thioesterase [Shewanella sp. NIFS-20-20]MBV7314548.1 tol-pal system-associated acyl-CoA thioesterase [Shewanella sp. NIFS-20-20]